MQKYKVHQISLPDYDNLKAGILRTQEELKNGNIDLIRAKAAVLATSICYNTDLDDIIKLWNANTVPDNQFTKDQIESEDVHLVMLCEFASYLKTMTESN